jgi:hypothetical protein
MVAAVLLSLVLDEELDAELKSLVVALIVEVLLVAVVEDGAELSSVVNALCAVAISSLDKAVETLERNVPKALLESALAGVSC